MSKRIVVVMVVFALLIGQVLLPVSASTNSSAYIFSVSLGLSQGSSSGKIDLDYSVTGMGVMSTIGIYKIIVYNSNGTKYRTIYGTTANGLLENNKTSAADTYSISCVAGNTYYCEVTAYAGNSTGHDTRTYITNSAVAKP